MKTFTQHYRVPAVLSRPPETRHACYLRAEKARFEFLQLSAEEYLAAESQETQFTLSPKGQLSAQ